MSIDESDIRVLHLEADGDPISTPDDASDLVGAAWSHQANLITVPVERLDPESFRLSTGIAGEIMQKLVNYRLRLAVIGDISEQLATEQRPSRLRVGVEPRRPDLVPRRRAGARGEAGAPRGPQRLNVGSTGFSAG